MSNYKSETLNGEWAKKLLGLNSHLSIPEFGYTNVPLSRWCFRLRCNSLTRIPVEIQSTSSGAVEDWPFRVSLRDLIWKTEASLLMRNAAYILKVKSGQRKIDDLFVFNPFSMTVSNQAGFISQANINNNQAVVRFDYSSDVLHGAWLNTLEDQPMIYMQGYNPISDILPGVSSASTGLMDAKLRYFIKTFSSTFFEHGAMPVTMLSILGDPQPEEVENVRSFFERAASSVLNAFRVVPISSDVKLNQITPPLEQLALEALDMTSEKSVRYSYEVPTSLVSDVSNRDLATQQVKSFFNNTVIPSSDFIAEHLNREVLESLGLKIVFLPQRMDMFQTDEAARTGSLVNLTRDVGLPIELSMSILGYDLSDDEWEQVEAIDAKNASEDAESEEDESQEVEDTNSPDEPEEETEAVKARSDLSLWRKKAIKSAGPVSFQTDQLSQKSYDIIMTATALCFNKQQVKNLFDNIKAVIEIGDEPTELRMSDEVEFEADMNEFLSEQVDRISNEIATTDEKPDSSFWKAELALLTALLVPFIAKWVESSISESAEELEPHGLSISAQVNAIAQDLTSSNAAILAKGLIKTTKSLASTRFDQFKEGAESFSDLIKNLKESIAPQWRSDLIARTEVTRNYADAKMVVSGNTEGVQGVVWDTLLDERVCPLCGPLHGVKKSDTEFDIPRHVGCRCRWVFVI